VIEKEARQQCCLALLIWKQEARRASEDELKECPGEMDSCEKSRLNLGIDLAEVFRQARHRFSTISFILDAVYTRQAAGASPGAVDLCGEAGDRVESYGGKRLTQVGKRDLDAVRKLCERNS